MTPMNTSLGRSKNRSQSAHFLRLPGRWPPMCADRAQPGRWPRGRWLVIELKREQSTGQTVGQLLRYVGWVRRHLAGKEESNSLEVQIVVWIVTKLSQGRIAGGPPAARGRRRGCARTPPWSRRRVQTRGG